MVKQIFIGCIFLGIWLSGLTQKDRLTVTAYYPGNASGIDPYDVSKLTHIIFSFCHLVDGRLSVDNAGDSLAIQKLVSLKGRYPGLKILLSLGGWGGCKDCSTVFATETGRRVFAASTKELIDYFKTDGIDLDWEYPAISGYPDHAFMPEDKVNFTLLVKELRNALGSRHEISFAAGGFAGFFDNSVEWEKVMPLVDRVNLMSYDLVHGYSTITGHHTPLYSTTGQQESADHGVRYLDSIGVPLNKIVIGAAFYSRIFELADTLNTGLHRPGKFLTSNSFRDFDSVYRQSEGYKYYWDPEAQAPYYFNLQKKHFVTFDNKESIRLKTRYALDKGLNGIMFWQLLGDKPREGLVDVIDRTLKGYRH